MSFPRSCAGVNSPFARRYRFGRNGCDIDQFDHDVRVDPSKVLHRVQDDAQDAELMDLNSTPTFFVNGKRHKGPWDSASLIRTLEAVRPNSTG